MEQRLEHLTKAITELTKFNATLNAKLDALTSSSVAADLSDVHAKLDRLGNLLYNHLNAEQPKVAKDISKTKQPN